MDDRDPIEEIICAVRWLDERGQTVHDQKSRREQVERLIRLAAAPEPLRVAGEEVERLRELVGKHLGPHLAISPTPRYEAVVNEFVRSVLALIEPSAGGGWRSIETAPKDGEKILLTNGHRVLIGGRAFICTGEQSPDKFWHCQGAPGYDPALKIIPTHWQPLPVSPTPDQPKQEVKDV